MADIQHEDIVLDVDLHRPTETVTKARLDGLSALFDTLLEKLNIKQIGVGIDPTDSQIETIVEAGNKGIKLTMVDGQPALFVSDAGGSKILLRSDGLSYFNGGNFGVGTQSPSTKLEIEGDGEGGAQVRAQAKTTGWCGYTFLNHSTSDNFHWAILEELGTNDLHFMYGNQAAAKDLTKAMTIDYATGAILIHTVKSGATQGASGAVANEVWKTSGHATLPDNVIMIGV